MVQEITKAICPFYVIWEKRSIVLDSKELNIKNQRGHVKWKWQRLPTERPECICGTEEAWWIEGEASSKSKE